MHNDIFSTVNQLSFAATNFRDFECK